MKEPKTFKYPRLYMRNTDKKVYSEWKERIRIIYPNGKTEYDDVEYSDYFKFEKPCWRLRSRNPYKQVKAMKDYDASCGYYETIFLGEIK